MNPVRGWALAAGLAGVLWTSSAQAGWKGVFDVTCFHRSAPAASYYAPVPDPGWAPPAPQQVCHTYYQQRCYYQPITTYRLQTYYEPVVTYRRTLGWEPVTSYRYRTYFDPCTGCFQRVATPYTSYRLRAQCNAVTNWVQRCGYVPQTSYQRCCYWEPQTCCHYIDPCTGAVIPTVAPQPGVTENPAVPRVSEYPPSSQWTPLYPPNSNGGFEGSGSSLKPKLDPVAVPPELDRPKAPVEFDKPRPAAQPKMDRIASGQPLYQPSSPTDHRAELASVSGQILGDRDQPRPGAQLVFVPDASAGKSTDAQADDRGAFQVHLPPGNYLVYVRDQNGRAIYHTTVNVKAADANQVRLVSR